MILKFLKYSVYIIFWGTYFLPVYSFEKAFRLGITDFAGLYPVGTLFWLLASIACTVLMLGLKKILAKNTLLFYVLAVVLYIVFYTWACSQTAWNYRINFGTTWRYSDVIFELVLPQWYCYVFGGLGVYFNYYYIKHIVR